jgi:drug/metabolite transporter (DMT)-like permease
VRLVAALAAVYVFWSSTYLAMRIAVAELPPLAMAACRFALAGTVLLVLAVQRGGRVPGVGDWLRLIPAAVLLFIGGNLTVMIGEKSVGSGGAAVVCATMPLCAGVFGQLFGERTSLRAWIGLLVGFVGIVVLMRGPSLTGKPEHIVLVCLSPVFWALGSVVARHTRRVGGEHATLVAPGAQMVIAAPLLAIGALVAGESLPAHVSTSAWLAYGYLIVFGSLLGFTAYVWLLRNASPMIATSYAYVNPILAVLIGAALGEEPLGWSTLVANVLIVGAMIAVLRERAGASS